MKEAQSDEGRRVMKEAQSEKEAQSDEGGAE